MAYFLPSPNLYNFLLLLFSCCFFLTLLNPTSSSPTQPTDLVKIVCENTTDYAFCVDALYSDPQTPTTHEPLNLAYISFTLACQNASDARHNMQTMLKSSRKSEYSRLLRKCVQLYGEANMSLERAFDDMNTNDSCHGLATYAADSARNARECQEAFRGRGSSTEYYSRLARMNRDFLGMAEICVVVSNVCSPNGR